MLIRRLCAYKALGGVKKPLENGVEWDFVSDENCKISCYPMSTLAVLYLLRMSGTKEPLASAQHILINPIFKLLFSVAQNETTNLLTTLYSYPPYPSWELRDGLLALSLIACGSQLWYSGLVGAAMESATWKSMGTPCHSDPIILECFFLHPNYQDMFLLASL